MNEKFDLIISHLVEARKFTISPTAIEDIDIAISLIDRIKNVVNHHLGEERV